MEVRRSQLQFISLEKGEMKRIREEGYIISKNGENEIEHWMTDRVASYSVDGEFGVFDVTMTQIGIGDVVPATSMGILERVDGDIGIGVVYEVDATVASKGFSQTDKFFTELTEAIDYYNKIKAFFKAEIKPC